MTTSSRLSRLEKQFTHDNAEKPGYFTRNVLLQDGSLLSPGGYPLNKDELIAAERTDENLLFHPGCVCLDIARNTVLQ